MILAVETRSNAVFGYVLIHGKSPCFSGLESLSVAEPDWLGLEVAFIDGGGLLECAF